MQQSHPSTKLHSLVQTKQTFKAALAKGKLLGYFDLGQSTLLTPASLP